MRRLRNRSAIIPANGASRRKGRNCSPVTMPSAAGRVVGQHGEHQPVLADPAHPGADVGDQRAGGVDAVVADSTARRRWGSLAGHPCQDHGGPAQHLPLVGGELLEPGWPSTRRAGGGSRRATDGPRRSATGSPGGRRSGRPGARDEAALDEAGDVRVMLGALTRSIAASSLRRARCLLEAAQHGELVRRHVVARLEAHPSADPHAGQTQVVRQRVSCWGFKDVVTIDS